MKLYFKYVGMLLKCQMQYKASFIMTAIGQFLVSFTAFLGVYFMFDMFNSVNGFEFSEILICFSITLMAFSLTECFGVSGGKLPYRSRYHTGERFERNSRVRISDMIFILNLL